MDKDKSIEVGFYIKRFNDLTSSNLPLLKIYRKRQIESVFIKKARHVSIMLGLKLCVFGKLQKSQIFATLET